MTDRVVSVRGVEKEFSVPGSTLQVLRGVDLDVDRGEIRAILGASGVGKSTLLHIVGTLDRPTRGSVEFDEGNVFTQSDADLAAFRNRHIGFVFQFHHLLPEFTALENVMIPGLIARESASRARARARDLLASVQLSDRETHRPEEMSGGEQQRVAVARSLYHGPRLVIADEPSGNLDPETADRLHRLVYTLAKEGGQSWIIATHNESLARIADIRSRLVQGKLVPDASGVTRQGPVKAAEGS